MVSGGDGTGGGSGGRLGSVALGVGVVGVCVGGRPAPPNPTPPMARTSGKFMVMGESVRKREILLYTCNRKVS